jgi:NADP-dependent 3-hydroxy acid dehydrogenase YdfG
MSKTVLITGATAGIGKACAYRFASEGYRLIVTGRRQDRLEKLKNDLNLRFGVEIRILVFDVRYEDQVEQAVSKLDVAWKSIDVLINNAGLALGLSPLQDGDTDDWNVMIDTNIKGLLYMSKVVSKLMIGKGQGHIINIGSIAGKEVYPNGNVYSATKHAVDAITKGMRLDLLKHGIRVTQVAPGAVETEFSLVRFKGDEERAAKVYDRYIPLKAEDIADVAFYTTTLPSHVNINDVLVMPTHQANATTFLKEG